MQTRVYGFTALLAVIGISITFGMILGGRLNAPQVVLASPDLAPIQLAPARSGPGSSGFADIVERVLPAVVGVESSRRVSTDEGESGTPFDDPFFRRWFGEPDEREQPRPDSAPRIGAGSGFIISQDGYILTNNHVVQDFEKIVVRLQSGESYDAQVVGTDPSIDLALIKVDADGEKLPSVPLGDSDALRVGEWVIAIGNPLEFEQTVTVGVVSGKERRLPSLPTDSGVATFIQTDAAINFGNSGGPLIDSQGNVVGINTAIRRANYAEGIGFALPINQARAVMEQLRQTGSVRRGYIGIRMNPNEIDETTAEYYGLPDPHGVIVSEVTPEGPAESAGLLEGDIIRSVDGEPIEDNLDLIGKISSRRPGDGVSLEVYRQGELVTMNAVLGDRESGLQQDGGRGSAPRTEPGGNDEPRESTRLGITVENANPRTLEQFGFEPNQSGVLVRDVAFGSDAADRGLQPHLVIVSVNEQATPDVATWESILDGFEPGKPIKLDVVAVGANGPQPLYFFLRAPGSPD